MDMQDRRVRRTQKALARALIALTLKKDYEAITIREITDHAEVGYATFFRHYHDKDALLEDILFVVLNELTSLLQAQMNDTDHATTGTLIFRYVQEHSEVVHVLFSSHKPSVMAFKIVEAGTQSVFYQNTPRTQSIVPPEIAAHHLVTSTISLIQWWLEHQMPYPPEQMGTIYQELIARPAYSTAFEVLEESRD